MPTGNRLAELARSPFAKFLLTGGMAAAVNIGSRHALSPVMPFELAVVVAYIFGMTTAYILARRYVFPRSGMNVKDEYIRFALVNIVALAQVWTVSVFLARWLLPLIDWQFHPELTAHVIGVLSPVVTSYYGHKLFTFKSGTSS